LRDFGNFQERLFRTHLSTSSLLPTIRSVAEYGKVYSFMFFSLPGYRYLGDGGTDRREILHDGTYRSRTDLLPFVDSTPRDPKNPTFWPSKRVNISKTVSRSVTCQLELNISSTRVSKNVSNGAVDPRGVYYKQKYVVFLAFSIVICDKREINYCVVERQLCITRGRSTQSAAYRAIVDGTLLPAVMDRIFVNNRDFYTPAALLPSLEKGSAVLHIV